MVDHGDAIPTDTEIDDIELSEELSALEAMTPMESDEEEEKAVEEKAVDVVNGLFGYNIFTKRNLFYVALLALAILAIICLCQGSDKYGCSTVNDYTPAWAADLLGETSSAEVVHLEDAIDDLSETSK